MRSAGGCPLAMQRRAQQAGARAGDRTRFASRDLVRPSHPAGHHAVQPCPMGNGQASRVGPSQNGCRCLRHAICPSASPRRTSRSGRSAAFSSVQCTGRGLPPADGLEHRVPFFNEPEPARYKEASDSAVSTAGPRHTPLVRQGLHSEGGCPARASLASPAGRKASVCARRRETERRRPGGINARAASFSGGSQAGPGSPQRNQGIRGTSRRHTAALIRVRDRRDNPRTRAPPQRFTGRTKGLCSSPCPRPVTPMLGGRVAPAINPRPAGCRPGASA